jgi:hypothetical protein
MRWQDAILVAVPAWDALAAPRKPGSSGAAARIAVAAAAAVAAFAPQSIVWQRLYGQPFTIPQGSTFMKWTSPALWQVLLSYYHGLFTWTPVLLLAVVGLVPRVPAVAFLLGSWYVNASVVDWWGGEAFGGRRFVACFPVFVLGAAALFERWREWPSALAGVCAGFVCLNGLLLLQYQMMMHGVLGMAYYPASFYGLYVARFVVPFVLARRWLLR